MNTLKILIVEDDESIREGLREALEMENYEVHTAAHGRDALNQLKASKSLPGLILLDLNMPVMAGREFLDHLRAETEPLARIPVVVMTAVPDVKLSGVEGVLKKPIDLDVILEKVGSFAR